MDRYKLAEVHGIRVDHVIDLASAFATGQFEGEQRWNSEVEDLVDCLNLPDDHMHPSLLPLAELFKQHSDDPDFVPEVMREYGDGIHNLAVRFSTPVRTYIEEGMFNCSWGYSRHTWVIAETYEAAWTLGMEWVKLKHGQDAYKILINS